MKIKVILALLTTGLFLGLGVDMLFSPPGNDVYVKVENVDDKDGRLYAKGFLYVQDPVYKGYVHQDDDHYELVRISDFVYKDLSVGDYVRVREPPSSAAYDGVIYKEWVLQLYWTFYLILSVIFIVLGIWSYKKSYEILKE